MQSNTATEPVPDEYCGTTYAARVLRLSVATIQSMVESGELQAWKTKGGHRRISLASVRRYMQQQGAASRTLENHAARRLRVLVVEDDEALREVYRGNLQGWDLPLDFTLMASAIEALFDISSLNPHVLVTDLRTPGIDGFEMVRMLTSSNQHQGMSIVAVTGLSSDEVAQRGGLPEQVIVRHKPLDMGWLHGFLTGQLQART